MPSFNEAALRRNKQKKADEDKANNQGFQVDYQKISWLTLEDQIDKVFRIIGKPAEIREKSTDVKLVLQSDILSDSGKSYMKINWKLKDDWWDYASTKFLEEDWLLFRLYRAIAEIEWIPGKEGEKAKREYVNAGYECLKRVESNSKPQDQYPPRFWPRNRILMNIIDRQDTWCQENKHSKLLSSKKSYWQKQDMYFYETGVPYQGVYGPIMDQIVEYAETGNWDEVDVITRKKSADKDYLVQDIKDRKIQDAAKKIGLVGPLTEEEKAYELYDLNHLYQTASYNKMKRGLTNLFKLADSELKVHYYEELCEAAEIEKEENDKKRTAEAKTVHPVTKAENQPPQVNSTPTRRQPQSVKADLTEEDYKKYFPKWDTLSKEDQKEFQKLITAFDSNGVPEYIKKDGVNLLPCDNAECKIPGTGITTTTPDSVLKCPVCGQDFAVEQVTKSK